MLCQGSVEAQLTGSPIALSSCKYSRGVRTYQSTVPRVRATELRAGPRLGPEVGLAFECSVVGLLLSLRSGARVRVWLEADLMREISARCCACAALLASLAPKPVFRRDRRPRKRAWIFCDAMTCLNDAVSGLIHFLSIACFD